jgi:lactate permease
MASSATVSNLTFGAIQYAAAVKLSLDVPTILALQLAGACIGNCIAIGNILACSSVLQVKQVEPFVLRKSIIPTLLTCTIFVLVSLIYIV